MSYGAWGVIASGVIGVARSLGTGNENLCPKTIGHEILKETQSK